MDFEEMKVIWDSQNDRPLYVLDEAGLHASVQREIRAFARRVLLRDVRDISLALITGLGLLVFGSMIAFGSTEQLQRLLGAKARVTHADSLVLLIASALWFFGAGYQWIERKRQKRREQEFDPSLRGDIDRTLAQTEQQIRLARSALWWSLIPAWVGTTLFTFALFTMIPTPRAVLFLWAVVLPLGFTVDLRCKRRLLRAELIPLKREFESLRRKLTEVEKPV